MVECIFPLSVQNIVKVEYKVFIKKLKELFSWKLFKEQVRPLFFIIPPPNSFVEALKIPYPTRAHHCN